MTDPNIAHINKLIENHANEAIEVLKALDDVCVHDGRMRSPLNVAIQFNNQQVVDYLATDKNAVKYIPTLDAELKKWIKHFINEHFEDSVEANEKFLAKRKKEEIYWERSPLLQACRYANKHAIGRLIQQGASLKGTDVLGYSALELCLEAGGTDLVNFFVESCLAHEKKIPVNDGFLRAIANSPELYERIITVAELGKNAQKVKFNLACALLKYDEVKSMLEAGYDVNTSVVDDTSPIAEVAFSNSAAVLKHPQQLELTKPHQRAFGDAKLVMTGSELQQELADNSAPMNLDALTALLQSGDVVNQIEKLLSQHGDAMASQFVNDITPKDIDPKIEPDDLIEKRIQLLDLLASHKLDIKKARKNADFQFTSDLLATNSPKLLDKLIEIGVNFEDEEELAEDLRWALKIGCFSIVKRFVERGFALPELEDDWQDVYQKYQSWLKVS